MPTRLRDNSIDAESQTDSSSPSPSPTPMPTPSSSRNDLAMRQRSDAQSATGSKRRRATTVASEPSNNRQRTVEPDNNENSDDDQFFDVYDPDQPLQERRILQKDLRNLLKDINENSEEYLQKDSHGLHDTILKANELSKKVKQTTEATIDSRLLVSTTDLSYRKALRLAQGSLSQGLDLDEFVSKAIAYMRHGGGISDDNALELSSTQRQRRTVTRRRGNGQAHADEDEDDEGDIGDEGDMMNWPHLGRFACLPHIRRPALPGFLLGPLSVEKKARRMTKRSAPFRPESLRETRPEVLDVDDMAKKENDLTALCTNILQHLHSIQAETQEIVADLIEDDMDDTEKMRLMHQHGLRSTGGIDLMRFVVNPDSFGQTVENMFYVSFLIRDGRVEIELDEHDLPAIAPVDREPVDDGTQQRHGSSKHQAILSMDEQTWREIIDVFQITNPMIPHRREANHSGPGGRGWFVRRADEAEKEEDESSKYTAGKGVVHGGDAVTAETEYTQEHEKTKSGSDTERRQERGTRDTGAVESTNPRQPSPGGLERFTSALEKWEDSMLVCQQLLEHMPQVQRCLRPEDLNPAEGLCSTGWRAMEEYQALAARAARTTQQGERGRQSVDGMEGVLPAETTMVGFAHETLFIVMRYLAMMGPMLKHVEWQYESSPWGTDDHRTAGDAEMEAVQDLLGQVERLKEEKFALRRQVAAAEAAATAAAAAAAKEGEEREREREDAPKKESAKDSSLARSRPELCPRCRNAMAQQQEMPAKSSPAWSTRSSERQSVPRSLSVALGSISLGSISLVSTAADCIASRGDNIADIRDSSLLPMEEHERTCSHTFSEGQAELLQKPISARRERPCLVLDWPSRENTTDSSDDDESPRRPPQAARGGEATAAGLAAKYRDLMAESRLLDADFQQLEEEYDVLAAAHEKTTKECELLKDKLDDLWEEHDLLRRRYDYERVVHNRVTAMYVTKTSGVTWNKVTHAQTGSESGSESSSVSPKTVAGPFRKNIKRPSSPAPETATVPDPAPASEDHLRQRNNMDNLRQSQDQSLYAFLSEQWLCWIAIYDAIWSTILRGVHSEPVLLSRGSEMETRRQGSSCCMSRSASNGGGGIPWRALLFMLTHLTLLAALLSWFSCQLERDIWLQANGLTRNQLIAYTRGELVWLSNLGLGRGWKRMTGMTGQEVKTLVLWMGLNSRRVMALVSGRRVAASSFRVRAVRAIAPRQYSRSYSHSRARAHNDDDDSIWWTWTVGAFTGSSATSHDSNSSSSSNGNSNNSGSSNSGSNNNNNSSSNMSASLVPANPADVMVIRNVTPNIVTFSVPFSRFGRIKIGGRGTLVKLTSGNLAVFSPVALTEESKAKVAALGGQVAYIIALDFEHHIFISEWAKQYPGAKIIGPDGLLEKRAKQHKDPMISNDSFAVVFTKTNKRTVKISDEFDADFDYEYVDGHVNKEIVFHYKPDKVLIEADLMFNLPPVEQYSKVPDGQKPGGFADKLFQSAQSTAGDATWMKRFNWYLAAKDRASVNDSIKLIDQWDFTTLIPCHGDVIEGNAKDIFRKVFQWHLQGKK
ncbi:hypothetical protein E4U55_003144 [Claviceps digitariae]|nr:hypothetical protein E4U55_003144 [Claviceps digitariae]